MQISVESTGGLGRTMRIVVPEDKIASEVEHRLLHLSRTTRVQGFRPGKVPYKIIRQRFGTQVRQEVAGEIVQSSLYEAITEKNLRPAGMPEIGSLDFEQGKGLEYTAKFEVLPEVTLAPVESLKINKTVCELTDQDIDKMIEALRKQHRETREVDRASVSGDVLEIDFEGFVEGKPFEGGTAQGFRIELGANRFIEGFEEGLTGKQKEDDVVLNLSFPEDYNSAELAGKPVEFRIKVNRVLEPFLPEMNDEFFKKFGVDSGGLDAFKKQILEQMERDLESALRNRLRDAVMDALFEANAVELPLVLVENEKHQLQDQLRHNLKSQGIQEEEAGKLIEAVNYEDQARKRVSLQLIVGELIKVKEIKAEPSKVKARIEKLAESYRDPAAIVQWYYSDKGRLNEIEAMVLEDEVIDAVSSQAQVTEVNSGFDEVMNKGQTETV